MNRKKRRETGAIAIEAILSLSIFMMAMIALMMGALLVRAQSAMQYALDQTAKEISGYFYLLDKVGVASIISGQETNEATAGLAKLNSSIGDIVNFSGSVEEEGQDLLEVAENAVSGNLTQEDIERIQGLGNDYEALSQEVNQIRDDLNNLRNGDKKLMFKSMLQVFSRTLINKSFSYLVTPLVCEALVPKYLSNGNAEHFYNMAGIHDVRFSGSEILADGRTITLICTYKVNARKLTLGFYRKDLQFRQVASTAAWVRPNSSGSLVSLEKVCANFDEEYAALHTITVEENTPPETTDTSEGEATTTAADDSTTTTDSETTESTSGTETTTTDGEAETTTTTSADEAALEQLISVYHLSAQEAARLRAAYELYQGDLFSAIGSCTNQAAAVQLIADRGNEGAALLVAAGQDGLNAYQHLNASSRLILLTNTNPLMGDDAFIRALVAHINAEGITKLTQRDVDQFAQQYRNGGAPAPEDETPDRATPEAEITGDIRTYVDGLSEAKRNAFLNAYSIYGADLLDTINACTDKKKAVNYIGKFGNEFALLLISHGNDGLRAFEKLNSESRAMLLRSHDFNPDDEVAKKLIEMILAGELTRGTVTSITPQDIANAQKAVEEAAHATPAVPQNYDSSGIYYSKTSNEGQALIAEAKKNNLKISENKVIGITRDKNGKIIWLEKGHLGEKAY